MLAFGRSGWRARTVKQVKLKGEAMSFEYANGKICISKYLHLPKGGRLKALGKRALFVDDLDEDAFAEDFQLLSTVQ
ncbi:hypothetical protein HDF08_003397 [Edaphobacter lichenicola]|uniref:Uncharacterized protein n=1 Tax=Tunturiibacter lichenicola TaxID=2051959 RepID=A0A852VMJ0_9BACT|nr:hypothetical protein [Edaphobacter lichenicola]